MSVRSMGTPAPANSCEQSEIADGLTSMCVSLFYKVCLRVPLIDCEAGRVRVVASLTFAMHCARTLLGLALPATGA